MRRKSEVARWVRRKWHGGHVRPAQFLFLLSLFLAIPRWSPWPEGEAAGAGETSISAELRFSLSKLYRQFHLRPQELAVIVDVSEQKMYIMKEEQVLKSYSISTSRYGMGSEEESFKTPLGTHRVFEKIGQDAPLGAIFQERKTRGRIAEIRYDAVPREGDLITTRILPLAGQEENRNKGPGVDSQKRGIYIHGTPEEGLIGTPHSRGCIRMRNRDIMELFEMVPVGTLVEIQP